MFRTRRAIISPVWTHSCQRSNDLCLLSPTAQLRWFKENGSHQADGPDLAILQLANVLGQSGSQTFHRSSARPAKRVIRRPVRPLTYLKFVQIMGTKPLKIILQIKRS